MGVSEVWTGSRDLSVELADRLRSVYSLILLIILWEAVGQFGLIQYYFLPPLSDILLRLVAMTQSGELLINTVVTLRRAFAGLLIAIVVGVPIGILMARIRAVNWFFDPIVTIGYPVPKISLIPIFILWFGIGDLGKILLVALDCSFPIIVNTRRGAENVDEKYIWSARMMGTSDRKLLWKVIIPVSAPGILIGIQIALPISLIITFILEMVASGGLGYLEIQGVRGFDSPQVYAAIFAIRIVGLTLDRALRVVRRRLLAWT